MADRRVRVVSALTSGGSGVWHAHPRLHRRSADLPGSHDVWEADNNVLHDIWDVRTDCGRWWVIKMSLVETAPMIPPTPTETLLLETDSDGVARVGKTRITLDTIIIALTNGATAEEIAHQYPSLQLADIYSVIGYYLCHRAEADASLQQHANRASKFAS